MKREVGLWIDHREAVIVLLRGQEEEITRIRAYSGKRIQYSGALRSEAAARSQDAAAKESRNRRFHRYLRTYYNLAIAYLREADSILLLGPGEAKLDLKKRLELQGLGERIVGIVTTDKMTDGQIAAQVRQYFLT